MCIRATRGLYWQESNLHTLPRLCKTEDEIAVRTLARDATGIFSSGFASGTLSPDCTLADKTYSISIHNSESMPDVWLLIKTPKTT